MHFAKGHGTENDFVIRPDPDAELDLTPDLVRRLCDRRAGPHPAHRPGRDRLVCGG